MKTYIIEYFSNKSNGVCIICESDRRKAIKVFNTDIRSESLIIKSINEVKVKSGIVYFN